MARKQNQFCNICRQESAGVGVLETETDNTQLWHWTCGNCNTVSEITTVKKKYIPSKKRFTRRK